MDPKLAEMLVTYYVMGSKDALGSLKDTLQKLLDGGTTDLRAAIVICDQIVEEGGVFDRMAKAMYGKMINGVVSVENKKLDN